MLIPRKDRVLIYENLFKEGVVVAKKDPYAPKHQEIECKNLYVMNACKSLKSRGYVKEQFAWRHYYWYLTNEGIQYLRDYLHLPPEIVPATLKRAPRPESARPKPRAMGGPGGPGGPPGDSQRQEYRRGPGGPDKTGEAGAGSQDFQYKGGYGRGRPSSQPQ